MKDLRQVLQGEIIVGDGAMGTYLYQLGYPVGISYESLNISEPERIRDIHREYVSAGARLLETNTFTANREKLSKHGMEKQVKAINRAAARLAREAAGGQAYVVGALGSIRAGKRENIETDQVKRDYTEQLSALLEEGVDGIMFETFYDMEEMKLAVQIVRALDDRIPIICQFAVEESHRTKDGLRLLDAFRLLREEGADIVGLNCRMGPNGLMRAMEDLTGRLALPMSAFPNAGLPDYVDGRYNFVATADYMAESAVRFAELGARIIGGCCGTTPEHIQAIALALADVEAPALPALAEEEAQAQAVPPLEIGERGAG
ncbi:homocysteine S-methyltransferase family protein, partial [Bacillus cereus]|nr:homocysteine S-methyltransferase family protein [Bacillus cereus]